MTNTFDEESFSQEKKLEDGQCDDKFKFPDSPPPQVVPKAPSFNKNKKVKTRKKNKEKQKVFIVFNYQ